ncbi:hypothetical protein AURDEDRAFT_140703 [Auricularia subglabra TFB-10046 SS5]|nr:hypothetical protein AURDEDRAFT_140703 [Auricularia subglabra TFB-10046 SS5]
MSTTVTVSVGDGFFPCRWDWCRVTFPTLRELVGHVTVHHINVAQRETPEQIKQAERLESEHPFSMSEESWLASTPRPSQQAQPAWSTQQTLSQSQPLPSQPVLLTPPRQREPAPKVEPESPAPHEWAGAHISLFSPKQRAAPLVAYSSRTSTPARSPSPAATTSIPTISFAALAASSVETPPLKRLPASPTSEEQIYRQLGPEAIESDTSVSSAPQQRKRKQPAAPSTPKQRQRTHQSVTPSGPPRRSSRHSTPVRDTPSQRAATTTPAKKPRRQSARRAGDGALPYASFSDAEVASDAERERASLPAIVEQEESGDRDESSQSQPQSQRFYTPSQSQSQLESQWEPQTQSLNLATQMPLSQETFD